MTTLLSERPFLATDLPGEPSAGGRQDGQCPVEIQLVAAHEAERVVVEVFEAMSDTARYFRFLGPMPQLSAQARRVLSSVEPRRHEIWAAQCGGRSVGLVRLVRDRAGRVELAVEVADSHVRQGLATRLVDVALAGAVDWDTDSVYLVVHPSNRAALALFRRMGAEFSYEDGVMAGELPVAA